MIWFMRSKNKHIVALRWIFPQIRMVYLHVFAGEGCNCLVGRIRSCTLTIRCCKSQRSIFGICSCWLVSDRSFMLWVHPWYRNHGRAAALLSRMESLVSPWRLWWLDIVYLVVNVGSWPFSSWREVFGVWEVKHHISYITCLTLTNGSYSTYINEPKLIQWLYSSLFVFLQKVIVLSDAWLEFHLGVHS